MNISFSSRKLTYTHSPSVTGVLEARLFSLWIRSTGDFRTVFCQRIFPLGRSMQISTRSWLPLSAATVKILSSQIIGEACPFPGSGVFQTTSFDMLQFVGIRGSFSVLPSPRGPRQPGQFSAAPREDPRMMRMDGASKKIESGRIMVWDWFESCVPTTVGVHGRE